MIVNRFTIVEYFLDFTLNQEERLLTITKSSFDLLILNYFAHSELVAKNLQHFGESQAAFFDLLSQVEFNLEVPDRLRKHLTIFVIQRQLCTLQN